MKKSFQFSTIISSIVILLVSIPVSAATYTTRANGNWNDVVNVWSLDGGLTPCACTPGTPNAGNNIVINHDIFMNYNVVFNGGNVVINPTGSLSGGKDINVWATNLDFFGPAILGKFVIGFSTNVTLHTGVFISASGKLGIESGANVLLDGAQINSGGLIVQSAGMYTLINGARHQNLSSNIRNFGTINIGLGSCVSSTGNWTNESTGIVTGLGVVVSGGNLKNDNIWDVTVDWCANGTALGLPIPENCPAADGICNGITLPVELVDFQANIDKDRVNITWATASEYNNDFFILMKSIDGENWSEVDRVDGVGTSTEMNYYASIDYEMNPGVTYYKLLQHDIDSRVNESEVISVNNKLNTPEVSVYPNPTKAGTDVTIANLSESKSTILIFNQMGRIVSEFQKEAFVEHITINTNDFQRGIYLIKISNVKDVTTKKLVVSF